MTTHALTQARPRNKQVFLILPILFTITSLVTRQQRGSYWFSKNYDPEYAYLLNFLSIVQLKTPGHTDHPGTPLQIFGGIVIQITYLFQSSAQHLASNITDAILQNPEFYLAVVNTALLLLTASCLVFLGWVAFSLCHNIILSLLLQLAPFLFVTSLTMSTRVTPETLLFLLTQLLVILLLFYIYSDVAQLPQFLIAIGIVLGLGVATKVTFLPLVLLIFLFPGIRQKSLVIITIAITFFLATLPILSQYPRVFYWLTSIAMHTGLYGGGDPGLVDTSTLSSAFIGLIEEDKRFFYIIGFSALNFLGITCCFISQRSKNPSLKNLADLLTANKFYRSFACILLIVLVQLLVTLKHPAIRYLFPSMGLCSLLILVQVNLLRQFLTPILKPIILSAMSWLVFGILITVLTHSVYDTVVSTGKLYESFMTVEMPTINRLIQEKYSQCVSVSYGSSSDKASALKLGADYSARQFSQTLQSLYPKSIFYNVWHSSYGSFTQPLDADIFLHEQCVIFQGPPFPGKFPNNKLPEKYNVTQELSLKSIPNARMEYKLFEKYNITQDSFLKSIPNAKIETIFEGPNQAVYLLRRHPPGN